MKRKSPRQNRLPRWDNVRQKKKSPKRGRDFAGRTARASSPYASIPETWDARVRQETLENARPHAGQQLAGGLGPSRFSLRGGPGPPRGRLLRRRRRQTAVARGTAGRGQRRQAAERRRWLRLADRGDRRPAGVWRLRQRGRCGLRFCRPPPLAAQLGLSRQRLRPRRLAGHIPRLAPRADGSGADRQGGKVEDRGLGHGYGQNGLGAETSRAQLLDLAHRRPRRRPRSVDHGRRSLGDRLPASRRGGAVAGEMP